MASKEEALNPLWPCGYVTAVLLYGWSQGQLRSGPHALDWGTSGGAGFPPISLRVCGTQPGMLCIAVDMPLTADDVW